MTTRKELLNTGIDKFILYCNEKLPNTLLATNVQKLKVVPIETITHWLIQNICRFSNIEECYINLITQSQLTPETLTKVEPQKLKNFILYFQKVLSE